jgi:PEGA domain
MHGKDITIPEGTEVTAYANGDMKLEGAKFQPASTVQQTSGNVPVANSSPTKVQVESNPSGADIEVDGSFVGSTPSEVQVAEGDHIVAVKKAGFNNWERKLKVSSGSNLHLSAELERVAQ